MKVHWDMPGHALELDPLREGAHRDLMRLYVALGRPSAALRQFDDMERMLDEELGTQPSAASRELVAQIASRSNDTTSDALPLDLESPKEGETAETSSVPAVTNGFRGIGASAGLPERCQCSSHVSLGVKQS